MKENTVMLCAIGALLLIMLTAWIINLIRAAKNKSPLRWLGRVVYMSGIICVVLNAIRTWRSYENSAGIFIAAHAIALFSILSAFVRSERQHTEKDKT